MTQIWEQALARSAVYELLSLAFLYPEDGSVEQLTEKTTTVAAQASRLGWSELEQPLQNAGSLLSELTHDALVTSYVDVFGHGVASDCPQYEGEYEQAHVFQKSQTLAHLNAFYAAFGVEANPDLKERTDHISVELEFMHLLTMKEAHAQLNNHGPDKVLLCRDAQKAFLEGHLAPWIKSFVKRVSRKAGGEGAYGALAHLLDVHMSDECRIFGLRPAPSHQTIIPVVQEEDLDCAECPVLAETP